MINFNKQMAFERCADCFNSIVAIFNLSIALMGIISKKKPVKIFATVWTIGTMVDNLRMAIVSNKAKEQYIGFLDEDDAEDVNTISMLQNTNLKYQFTGNLDDINYHG